MANNKLYTEKSIESLTPLQFTRLRPQVYCGDISYSTQLLIEIISNSIDEFRLGHGNLIKVKVNGTTISVRDYGQGFIPNSFREDGKTILEAAFSVLNTSGKYREDGTYEGTSLGSFGIGSKLATFLSHTLDVTTYRDGMGEHIHFVEGEFHHRDIPKIIEETGTYVKWTPSEEFFGDVHIENKVIKNLFKTITCLCPGLTIQYNNNNEIEEYVSLNGINDLVDEATKGKEILKNRLNINFNEDKNKIDMVLTYTNAYNATIVPYVNTGLTESGPHITVIKAFLTREFNKFFKAKKWIKEKDENFTGDEIQEGMYLVFNITAPNVGYDAQVKSRITKIEMAPFMEQLTENTQLWLAANEAEIKKIVDKAIMARKAKEAAKKAKDTVRNINKKKEKALKFDSKLADCYSKDRSKCEIYITEGK